MSLSSFLIRIVLLVIPGIIGSLLYRRVRGRASRKDWEDYLEILVFSFLSYGCYGLFVYVLNKVRITEDPFAAFKALTNESMPIDAPIGHAIFFSSLISVPLAFAASYVDEYKLINKFARLIKASQRFGDEDVWDYFRRSPDTRWVYVRDLRNDIYYYGWIQAWSDPYKERELLLREVDVYKNSTAEFLYAADVVYVSRKHDDLTIEADLVSNQPTDNGQEPEAETTHADNR